MNHKREKAARRKLLLYYLNLSDGQLPGVDGMVRKIGAQIKDPTGEKIEVIYPNGNVISYYGQKAVTKRYRMGRETLVRYLHNGEADREGRRYIYA